MNIEVQQDKAVSIQSLLGIQSVFSLESVQEGNGVLDLLRGGIPGQCGPDAESDVCFFIGGGRRSSTGEVAVEHGQGLRRLGRDESHGAGRVGVGQVEGRQQRIQQ